MIGFFSHTFFNFSQICSAGIPNPTPNKYGRSQLGRILLAARKLVFFVQIFWICIRPSLVREVGRSHLLSVAKILGPLQSLLFDSAVLQRFSFYHNPYRAIFIAAVASGAVNLLLCVLNNFIHVFHLPVMFCLNAQNVHGTVHYPYVDVSGWYILHTI